MPTVRSVHMRVHCTVHNCWTQYCTEHHHHHNHFTAPFPGSPTWAGARRELLDFMVQGKISRGRHTHHPAGRHPIRTNQCPSPPSPHTFYRPDAIPVAQPTASKHWRQYCTEQTWQFSPPTFPTIIIAPMTSIWGRGHTGLVKSRPRSCRRQPP